MGRIHCAERQNGSKIAADRSAKISDLTDPDKLRVGLSAVDSCKADFYDEWSDFLKFQAAVASGFVQIVHVFV